MVHRTDVQEIQKSYKQNSKQPTKSYFQLLFSSLASAIFAITITLLLVIPIVRQEFSDQQAMLAGRLSSVEPVNSTNAIAAPASTLGVCQAPSGSGESSSRLSENKPALHVAKASPSNDGKGGGNIVEQFLSENKTSNSATISKTGANSTNSIAQVTKNTTTLTNTNTVSASVNNPQVAKSGSVLSDKNTTSASTSSGNALNNSDVSFIFTIKQP